MTNIMAANEPERPLAGWKYAYVGGAIDFGSNLKVSVGKASDRAVGYFISVQLMFNNTDPAVLGFLDEFCQEHGINPRMREDKTSYRLEVSKRDDLKLLLQLTEPFLIARHTETEVLLKNLLPGLEIGKGSSEDGFIELMKYVDEIRDETPTRSEPKYDEAYFRDEWDM